MMQKETFFGLRLPVAARRELEQIAAGTPGCRGMGTVLREVFLVGADTLSNVFDGMANAIEAEHGADEMTAQEIERDRWYAEHMGALAAILREHSKKPIAAATKVALPGVN